MPLLFLFLVFTTFSINGIHCFVNNVGDEKKILNLQQLQFQHHNPSPPSTSCLSHKSRKQNGAIELEIKHRDSCSGQNLDFDKKQQKRLILDYIRVRSLQSRFRKANSMKNVEETNTADTQIPLTSGISLQTLNYVVTIELGGKKMAVIVDTGSDLTWVQCQPCKQCYAQQGPIFNPSTSQSYQSVLCNSTTCQSLAYATGSPGVCGADSATCSYDVSYGDGSYTRGDLAMDRLDFGNTSVTNFTFGCGRNNKGLFGGASGLMGLGRSSISLISQTSAIFGGIFSYCLPTTAADASGSLVLGGNSSAYKNTTPISYTGMIPNFQLPTFYFLNLTGISIGGVALQASSFGRAGILLDSGTVISRLPPSMYTAVKQEFLKQFSDMPSAPGFSILDTCFNLSSYDEVNIPTLKMQFDGYGELSVDVTGMFYFVKTDATQVCLALASLSYEDEIGIIGNYQQRNRRIIYDTVNNQFGFAEEDCSYT